MRVAIDTQSLRPPLTGIGHFVHRLTNAMLPLLASNEELLSFNGWGLEPLDRNFLLAPKCAIPVWIRNSRCGLYGTSPARGMSFCGRCLPSSAKAFARCGRAFPSSAEKNFDLFHAANFVTAGNVSQAGIADHLRSVALAVSANAPEGARGVAGDSSSSCLLTCRSCRRFPNSRKARSLPFSACRQIEFTSPTRRQARSFGRSGKRRWLPGSIRRGTISIFPVRRHAGTAQKFQDGGRSLHGIAGLDPSAVSAAVGRSIRLGRYLAFAGGRARQAD